MSFFKNRLFLNVLSLLFICVNNGYVSAVFDATTPLIRIDPSGNRVAVWQAFDGTDYILQGATGAGSTWSSPVEISGTFKNTDVHSMGMNGLGDVVVVWIYRDFSTGNRFVAGAMLPQGSTWTTQQISSSSESAEFNDQDVAINDAGDVAATWTAYLGDFTPRIRGATGSIGTTSWSGPTTISN